MIAITFIISGSKRKLNKAITEAVTKGLQCNYMDVTKQVVAEGRVESRENMTGPAKEFLDYLNQNEFKFFSILRG